MGVHRLANLCSDNIIVHYVRYCQDRILKFFKALTFATQTLMLTIVKLYNIFLLKLSGNFFLVRILEKKTFYYKTLYRICPRFVCLE